jgi:hypothetical protein
MLSFLLVLAIFRGVARERERIMACVTGVYFAELNNVVCRFGWPLRQWRRI